MILLAILKAISQDSARFEILDEKCQIIGDFLINLNRPLPGKELLEKAYSGEHFKVRLKSKKIAQIYPLK